mmetsp:Transcript_31382/g.83472  ORF Transcript_31382/g.83472 Transcript_31382/m.83472 type:complete len:110 (-) Transcript_31382:553-882(-)
MGPFSFHPARLTRQQTKLASPMGTGKHSVDRPRERGSGHEAANRPHHLDRRATSERCELVFVVTWPNTLPPLPEVDSESDLPLRLRSTSDLTFFPPRHSPVHERSLSSV